MPKTVLTDFDVPGRLDVATGEIVEAADWQTFIEAGNHLFSRSGIRIGGQCFDPAWETKATAYKSESDTGGQALNQTHASGRLLRLLLSAQFKLTLRSYSQDCQLQLEVVRHDDTGITSLGTAAALNAGTTPAWAEASITLAQADTLDGGVAGADPQALGFLVRGRTARTQALLYQYDIIAKIAAASELPDGS